jgi:AcrR family transcriptional regulator
MDAIAAGPEPQQARSRETRRHLVEACIGVLVERGLARTSTTEVCRRAGVSQGALFKHFPTQQALFATTIEAEADRVAFLTELARRVFAPEAAA